MRHKFLILVHLGFFLLLAGRIAPLFAGEKAEEKVVYLIPVRQAIFQPQLFLLRRGVEQAVAANADAIVLLMDTPGGSVEIMREMVSPIIDVGIPTYTLVEKDAFSAGAIIALATDHIYMTPRSVIGDAMPVIMGQGGYVEQGEAEREKIESGMDAIVRSIAQAKGRDENLIRAMVRRDLEFTLADGTVISAKGNILTLTHQEAERILPDGSRLLSEGTVADLDEMLEKIGMADARRIELIPSLADDLALLITKIAPLLMGLAMLLAYMEFQSPGIGWAGGLAAILFIIVLFGHNVAGLSGMEDVLLIVIGLLLLLLEIFVLPGFGIAGITGILLITWGMIQAMTIRYPGNPGDLPGLDAVGNLGPAISNLGLAVIGAAVCVAVILHNLNENSRVGGKLILASNLDSALEDTRALMMEKLIGQNATVLTSLRPSGTISLNGENFDAVSEGSYLEADSIVRVIDVRNHRLVVDSIPEETT
jgi:membrane-bound serine protease (ClpP class)